MTHPPRPAPPPRGSTLVDLMLVVALLGMILAGVTRFSLREIERAEINALAIELSGWLEAIQKASMRLPAPPGGSLAAGGCEVRLVESPAGLAAGETVAQVRLNPASRISGGPGGAETVPDSFCHPETTFRMPATRQAGAGQETPRLVITSLSRTGDTRGTILFTPRGTVTNTSPVELVIRHLGSSRAVRCVRVAPITGLIELGHNNSGSSDSCPEASFQDLI